MLSDIVTATTTWGELIVAVSGALAAIGYGIRRMYKMAKNIEKLVALTVSNDQRLQKIESQFYNNGGGSLRDAIDRIEKRVKVLETDDAQERAS